MQLLFLILAVLPNALNLTYWNDEDGDALGLFGLKVEQVVVKGQARLHDQNIIYFPHQMFGEVPFLQAKWTDTMFMQCNHCQLGYMPLGMEGALGPLLRRELGVGLLNMRIVRKWKWGSMKDAIRVR